MNPKTVFMPIFHSFLGEAPVWYKWFMVSALILNLLVLLLIGKTATAYLLVLEFIFTLAMALYCYPLQAGGLLALQAVLMGLATPAQIYEEIALNLPVFLLLMYMVAGIYFMKEILVETFARILLAGYSRLLMNVVILVTSALLSAFLDALTVMAVLITVAGSLYSAYKGEQQKVLHEYLMAMVMHGAVGTAVGGVCTLVGEPQNLLIAQMAGWEFVEFAVRMAPITLPCAVLAILTCILLEYFGVFHYGKNIDDEVRQAIAADLEEQRPTDPEELLMYRTKLKVQALCALLLCIGLIFHLAEVGLIGLTIIVLLTAFTGVVEEKKLGPAFHEAMPFTALLCCFFAIVAVIHGQHLFEPVSQWVQSFPSETQPAVMFLATGFLSVVSDNVFVATIYMKEIMHSLESALISREEFNSLAIAVNTGTNLPSVATPNGQAAFLFLLTSSLAPRLGLSYMRMVYMALPYTVVLSLTGFIAVVIYL